MGRPPSSSQGAVAWSPVAQGTIGSAVVDRLLGAGAGDVAVLDDLSRGRTSNLPLSDPRLQLVEGDVRDAALLHRLAGGRELIFHLAAIRITRCVAEPRVALEVLADGTFNVAEAAVAQGVRKIVFSSSASVYGQASSFPTAETHAPWGDQTIYGSAKTFGEGVLRSLHKSSGLQSVALRYFNVYGPRMDAHGRYTEVLIRWMERIAAGQPPLIFGDGSQTMDFVHVHDIAAANLLAAEADVDTGAFNVASGRETSLVELAALLASAMGRPDLAPEFAPARAEVDVQRRLADTRLAEDVLGFHAEIPLEQGLVELVDWWRRTSSSGQEQA
jgi:UDP-glucose 4-epimerase